MIRPRLLSRNDLVASGIGHGRRRRVLDDTYRAVRLCSSGHPSATGLGLTEERLAGMTPEQHEFVDRQWAEHAVDLSGREDRSPSAGRRIRPQPQTVVGLQHETRVVGELMGVVPNSP